MKNLLPLKSLLSFALLVCSTNISANKIISVSDFTIAKSKNSRPKNKMCH